MDRNLPLVRPMTIDEIMGYETEADQALPSGRSVASGTSDFRLRQPGRVAKMSNAIYEPTLQEELRCSVGKQETLVDP